MKAKHFAVFLLLCGVLCLLCSCGRSDEQKAYSLLEQGKFDEAREIYTQMIEEGNDVSYLLKACDYDEAAAAYAAGDYPRAIELYEALGPYYRDCAELLQKAKYDYAVQLKESGNNAEALVLFAELGDYEQSKVLFQECAALALKDPHAGDTVFFGTFEQDKDSANGAEPIQWRVLAREGDYALLLSEHLLRCMEFGQTNKWEDSEVRTWLNGEFFDTAFSGEEQDMIQSILSFKYWEGEKYSSREQMLDVMAPILIAQDPELANDLEELERRIDEYMKQLQAEYAGDSVFLLSAQEVRGLIFLDKERIASLTSAAETRGATGTRSWWTRSRTNSGTNQVVVTVRYDGEVNSVHPSHSDVGVRPVICISLSGQTTEDGLDLELFGYPSDADLYDTETASEGSSSGSCPTCKGSGTIRFYYGSSDLEAWLSGHDAYTLGTCPMCNGTGRVKG